MRYRRFGRTGWDASVLGFGAMRLPYLNEDPAQIDEPEATRMLRRAIDGGVNYIDTAYIYHSGQSEGFVGKVLADGYRERVKVATKYPIWQIEKDSDGERILAEQLARLQVPYIDFYLLHGLNAKEWGRVKEFRVLQWAETALASGRIKHLGFSFHDRLEVFKEIIEGYDNWEFCQIQYNYLDIDYQAGREGLRYAAAQGLPVVVMEPLRGGWLAAPPAPIRDLFGAKRRSPADLALQWLWSQPEVTVVLSGMSTFPQVEENLASADQAKVGALTKRELTFIDGVRREALKTGWVPCTGCRYCLPCPSEVDIPSSFEAHNLGLYVTEEKRRARVAKHLESTKAGACTACGECEEKCPQHLEIPKLLARACELLGVARAEPSS